MPTTQYATEDQALKIIEQYLVRAEKEDLEDLLCAIGAKHDDNFLIVEKEDCESTVRFAEVYNLRSR